MAKAKTLSSGALSAYCDGIAMMLAAGIQTDEAVQLLGENMEPGPFKRTCDAVYMGLIQGKSLSQSMTEVGNFPTHMLNMIKAGESAGRLESVLKSLAVYYNEEDRLFSKMRSAILYPAGLMAVMTIILIFTVVVILPVFVDVYNSISGTLQASAFAYVNVSMGVGYIALVFMAVCTIAAIALALVSNSGDSAKVLKVMEVMPFSKDALYHMALSRFTAALATFTSAGVQSDDAMLEAVNMVDHGKLSKKAQATYDSMISISNPKSLSQAIYENKLFDPVYGRMMLVSDRSGSIEGTLQSLSDIFFDDAVIRIDSLIDSVEPALAAFLTVSVGATLIAVMLPLIGIMGSIG